MHIDRDRGLHMFNIATANLKWSGKSEGLAYTEMKIQVIQEMHEVVSFSYPVTYITIFSRY